jgi:hypothetical protein
VSLDFLSTHPGKNRGEKSSLSQQKRTPKPTDFAAQSVHFEPFEVNSNQDSIFTGAYSQKADLKNSVSLAETNADTYQVCNGSRCTLHHPIMIQIEVLNPTGPLLFSD